MGDEASEASAGLGAILRLVAREAIQELKTISASHVGKRRRLWQWSESTRVRLARALVLVKWVQQSATQSRQIQTILRTLGHVDEGFDTALMNLIPVLEATEDSCFPSWDVNLAVNLLSTSSNQDSGDKREDPPFSELQLLQAAGRVPPFCQVTLQNVSGVWSLKAENEFELLIEFQKKFRVLDLKLFIDVMRISPKNPIQFDISLEQKKRLLNECNFTLNDCAQPLVSVYQLLHKVVSNIHLSLLHIHLKDLVVQRKDFPSMSISLADCKCISISYWPQSLMFPICDFSQRSRGSLRSNPPSIRIFIDSENFLAFEHCPTIEELIEFTYPNLELPEFNLMIKAVLRLPIDDLVNWTLKHHAAYRTIGLYQKLKEISAFNSSSWKSISLSMVRDSSWIQRTAIKLSFGKLFHVWLRIDSQTGNMLVTLDDLSSHENRWLNFFQTMTDSLNASWSNIPLVIKSLAKVSVYDYIFSLALQNGFSVTKTAPLEARHHFGTQVTGIFISLYSVEQFSLCLILDDSETVEFFVVETTSFVDQSASSLLHTIKKKESLDPGQIAQILKSGSNNSTISFRDIMTALDSRSLSSLIRHAIRKVRCIQLHNIFLSIDGLTSQTVGDDLLLCKTEVKIPEESIWLSGANYQDRNLYSPKLGCLDVSFRIHISHESEHWRAQLTSYFKKFSALFRHISLLKLAIRNPGLTQDGYLAFEYNSIDLLQVQRMLFEVNGFFQMATVAFLLLETSSGDIASRNALLGDWNFPPHFFRLFSLDYSELRLTYLVPQHDNNSTSYSNNSGQRHTNSVCDHENNNVSRSQPSSTASSRRGSESNHNSQFFLAEITIYLDSFVNQSNFANFNYHLKFRPCDYPQRILFEQRINRNLFSEIRRVLFEVYRSHKMVSQITVFLHKCKSCNMRFEVPSSVEVVARTETDLLFVYRCSSPYQRLFKLLDVDTVYQDVVPTPRIQWENLNPCLLNWWLKCQSQDVIPDLLGPNFESNGILVTKATADRQLAADVRFQFSSNCRLSTEEQQILTNFFRISVMCVPLNRPRTLVFFQILQSPFHVLKTMIGLMAVELQNSNIASQQSIIGRSASRLKFRNRLTMDPSFKWTYVQEYDALYIFAEFLENTVTQQISSRVRQLGLPKTFLPLCFSFRERQIQIWHYSPDIPVNSFGIKPPALVNSPKLSTLLEHWDRHSLATAIEILQDCSFSDLVALIAESGR